MINIDAKTDEELLVIVHAAVHLWSIVLELLGSTFQEEDGEIRIQDLVSCTNRD